MHSFPRHIQNKVKSICTNAQNIRMSFDTEGTREKKSATVTPFFLAPQIQNFYNTAHYSTKYQASQCC